MGVRRFSHVGICVSDLDRSIRFYRDHLGFREQYGYDLTPDFGVLMELDGVTGTSLFLERDGVRIELLAYDRPAATGTGEPREMNARGVTHFGVRVDDLDAVADALRSDGFTVLEHTRLELEGIDGGPLRKWVFATDPDGVRVELVQLPEDYSPAAAGASMASAADKSAAEGDER